MTFTIGSRVRFVSDHPETEPVGTITAMDADTITITWDDEHLPSVKFIANIQGRLETV